MALRFVDGFDHYTSNDFTLPTKWSYNTFNGNFGNAIVNATYSRNQTGSGVLVPAGCLQGKIIDAQTTWVVGFAFKFTGFGTNASNGGIFILFDGSWTSNQISILFNNDGSLSAYRGNFATLLGKTTNVLFTNVWNYLEFKTVISATVGSITILVNGTSWLTLTGINTSSTGGGTADRFAIGNYTNGVSGNYDDLYVCDGTGSINNNFLGDVRVSYLSPNGAGTTTQLGIGGTSPAATNWQSVSQTVEDGDITYVTSNTVGNEDTYALTDMPFVPATINGIQSVFMARKDDAGNRAIARILRSGGADYAGPTIALNNTYQFYTDIIQQDPATSANWTATGINALEAGSKVIS